MGHPELLERGQGRLVPPGLFNPLRLDPSPDRAPVAVQDHPRQSERVRRVELVGDPLEAQLEQQPQRAERAETALRRALLDLDLGSAASLEGYGPALDRQE